MFQRWMGFCLTVAFLLSQAQAFLTLPDRLIKPAFSTRGIYEQMRQPQQGFGFGGGQMSPAPAPWGTLFYVPTTDGNTAIFVKNKTSGQLSVFGEDAFKFVNQKGWDIWAKNTQGAFEFNGIDVSYGSDSSKKVKIASTVPGYTGEFPVVTTLTK